MTGVVEAVSNSAVARSQRRRCRGQGAGRSQADHGESGRRGRSTPPYSSGSTCPTELAEVAALGQVSAQVPEVMALAAGRVQAPVEAEPVAVLGPAGASSVGGRGCAAASGSGSSPVASPSKPRRHQQQ